MSLTQITVMHIVLYLGVVVSIACIHLAKFDAP